MLYYHFMELFIIITICFYQINALFDISKINSTYNDYTKLLLYEDGAKEYLIVSLKNHILKVPLQLNGGDMEIRKIGPTLHSDLCNSPDNCLFKICPSSLKTLGKCNKTLTDVYVKTWTTNITYLFVCYNIYQGLCETLSLNDITGKPIGKSYSVVNPNINYHSTVVFLNEKLYFGIEINVKTNYLETDFYTISIRTVPNFQIVESNGAFFYLSHGKLGYGKNTWFPLEFKGSFPYKDSRQSISQFSYAFFLVDKPHDPLDVSNCKYNTRLVRICGNDHDFSSFMDYELKCGDHTPDYYTKIDSWSFTKVGSQLSKWYRQNSRFVDLIKEVDADFEHVLFVNFKLIKISTNYMQVQKESVMCAYPIAEIMEMYDIVKQKCDEGEGHTNYQPYNIESTTYKCIQDTASKKKVKGFCGGTKGQNKFIIGYDNDLKSGKKAMVMKITETRGRAMKVVQVYEKYTIAVVGGENGYIYIIELIENRPRILESRQLFKEPIKDIVITNSLTAIVISKNEIIETNLTNCQTVSLCSDCITLSPLCGWCVTKGACVLKQWCDSGEKYWIEYERNQNINKCPTIEKLKTTSIKELSDSNLVQFEIYKINPESLKNIKCIFRIDDIIIHKSYGTRVHGNTIKCTAPDRNNIIKLKFNHDFIKMKLELNVNDTKLSEIPYYVYDCSFNTNCSQCTNSQFDCSWCMSTRKCAFSKSKTCETSHIIPHQQANKCPKIELLKSSYSMKSNVLINIRIIKLNIDLNDDVTFYCTENCNNKTVLGTLNGDILVCQFGKINIREYKEKICKLNVNWKSKNIDISVDVPFELYDCINLANQCDDCLLLSSKYECGYCTANYKCVDQIECGVSPWIHSITQSSCPSPVITSIYPSNSTLTSESIITIRGYNFGFQEKDIESSISLEHDNYVLQCNFIKDGFIRAKQFRCQIRTTTNSRLIQIAAIKFNVVYKSDIYKAKKTFWFYKPVVTKLIPNYGPLIGGSRIEIVGKYLNIGEHRLVYFQQTNKIINCTIIKTTNTSLICRIGNFPDSSQNPRRQKRQSANNNAYLNLEIDKYKKGFNELTYSFHENPRNFKIFKTQFFYRGGQQTGIDGYNIHVLYKPCISVECPHMTTYCKNCIRNSDNNTICSIPKVTVSDRRQSCYLKIGIGEGYTIFYKALVEFYPLPTFSKKRIKALLPSKSFSFFRQMENKDNVFIQIAYSMTQLFKPNNDDFNITIGDSQCLVELVNPAQIQCRLHSPNLLTGRYYDINLQLGEGEQIVISTIEFQQGGISLDIQTIVTITVLVSVLIIVVVVTAVVTVRRVLRMQAKNNKNTILLQRKTEKQVNEMVKAGVIELNTIKSINTDMIRNFQHAQVHDFNVYVLYNLFRLTHPRFYTAANSQESVFFIDRFRYDVNQPLSHPLLYQNRIQVIEGTLEYSRMLYRLFEQKFFVLNFFKFVDECKEKPQMKNEIISLLSIILLEKMNVYTEILKLLIRDEIDNQKETIEEASLLRSSNSLSNFLSNWLKILMYEELKKSNTQGNLLILYLSTLKAINEGPVDPQSEKSFYALNDKKLYKCEQPERIKVHVKYKEDDDVLKEVDVLLLKQDTAEQVKVKILEEIFKYKPYSLWKNLNEFKLYKGPESYSKEPLLNEEKDIENNDELLCEKVPLQDSYFNTMNTSSSNYNKLPDLSIKSKGSRLSLKQNSDKKSAPSKLCFKPKTEKHDKNQSNPSAWLNAEILKRKLDHCIRDLFDDVLNQRPPFISDLFYYFDELVHDKVTNYALKANSLILRFWVDIITNVDFLFDVSLQIHPAVSHCLMSVCSVLIDIFYKDHNSNEMWLNQLFQTIIQDYTPKACMYFEKGEMPEMPEMQNNYEIPSSKGINISFAIVILYHKFLHKEHFSFIEYIRNTNIPLEDKDNIIKNLEEVKNLYTPETLFSSKEENGTLPYPL